MFEIIFSPQGIASIVGVVIAILFAYFPKLRTWFAGLASEVKSYIMLGVLLLAEIVISLLSYYQVIVTVPPFTWVTAVQIAFALLISNQPTYTLLPEAKDVKEVRVSRDILLSKEVAKRMPK
jgi:putative flippase GtrA